MTEQAVRTVVNRRAEPPPQLKCNEMDNRMSLTEQAVLSLKQTNEGLTTKMDLLLAQMTKIALLEERNITQQVDLGRAHAKIDSNSEKFDNLALESRAFMNYTKGQNKILWAIGAAVAALVVKALFFAANHGMTP